MTYQTNQLSYQRKSKRENNMDINGTKNATNQTQTYLEHNQNDERKRNDEDTPTESNSNR